MIEDKDFIGKIWHQNCGDDLLVIEKSNVKRGTQYLFKGVFQKYPYEVLKEKKDIIKGSCQNPQIEKVEFIDKIWPQNCGDSLKIIEKTTKKNYWKCEFIKYPYILEATKLNIRNGNVLNPLIEQNEFVGKIFKQNCGDFLLVLEKTSIKDKNSGAFLFKCQFQNYKNEVLVDKRYILKGEVDNNKLPWRSKESCIDFINKNFKDKKPTLEELSDKLNISYSQIVNKINEWEIRDLIEYNEIKGGEFSLKEYIKNKNINILENYYIKDKDKYYEIDIYIPDLKIGFEFNGNYWHSNIFKKINYHQEKSLAALNNNIKIFHIWEWEYYNFKDKIEYFINQKLGIFNKKIFARKCIIKELDYRTYADFCNKNHLQGEAGAKVKLGLFYKDELVQVMSFGSPRFTSDFDWEIIRECSKLGYIIIGGKEKLWSYFLKNYSPSNCISYCDFSKFTGESYLKLGFKKERLNKPGFWWWKTKNEIYWRNPNQNKEFESKNFSKLYDCGQLVFIWNC